MIEDAGNTVLGDSDCNATRPVSRRAFPEYLSGPQWGRADGTADQNS
jgi:hypothetical protein